MTVDTTFPSACYSEETTLQSKHSAYIPDNKIVIPNGSYSKHLVINYEYSR